MRIAVLIFGRLDKCANHHPNIVGTLSGHGVLDFFFSSDNSSPDHVNDFIKLYKPISYTNEPIKYDYDLNIYPGKKESTIMHNMTCHFINKNRVFSLLEEHINKTNTQYDVVISLRNDLMFHNRFNFNNLLDNTIYIPEGNDAIVNGINDQVAYGKLDVMKKYNSINPVELLELKLTIPHPESLTWANLQYHKIDIKRVDLKHYIYR